MSRLPRRAVEEATVTPLLLRDREMALLLGVSVSQIAIWRRAGLLHAVRLPGIRAVRYARAEGEALARRCIAEAGVEVEGSAPQEITQLHRTRPDPHAA